MLISRGNLLFIEESLLNGVLCVPACQRGLRTKVLACQRGLRANVPKAYQFLIFTCQRASERANVPYNVPVFQLNVPKCQKAYQCFNLACQRAKRRVSVSTWGANVPKGVPIFQTFFLRNAKGNLYSLYYIS